MKTLFLASTLFLTEFANVIAVGIDKLDWHQHSEKSDMEVLSTDVPDTSFMLFDPRHDVTQARSTVNTVSGYNEGKSVDIASINFLVPKEKSIRYEQGALVWEVKI